MRSSTQKWFCGSSNNIAALHALRRLSHSLESAVCENSFRNTEKTLFGQCMLDVTFFKLKNVWSGDTFSWVLSVFFTKP